MAFIATYRENGDHFVVSVRELSHSEGRNEFELHVLRVYASDPRHGVRYKVGDYFTISRMNAEFPHPQMRCGWTLTVEG